MASRLATLGSQVSRTASEPWCETTKLPMPCMANIESRWALSYANASRTTVTASESTVSYRPP